MPWFKVDDGFHGHPKVVQLSTAAVGLWLLAGTWSSQYLTDGKVPAGTVARLGGSPESADELVAAGLWETAPGGFQFHEWAEYQPTKEVVEAERAAARQRMATARAKKKGVLANALADEGGSSAGVTPKPGERSEDVRANNVGTDVERAVEVRVTPSQPDPSRPVPESPKGDSASSSRSRGTRIPDPFVVTGAMREWAAAKVPGLDVDAVTERFVDYWRGVSGARGVKADWESTWRNWLRRAFDDGPSRREAAASPHSARTLQALSVVDQFSDDDTDYPKGITA